MLVEGEASVAQVQRDVVAGGIAEGVLGMRGDRGAFGDIVAGAATTASATASTSAP